jgi:hypothetical protein
LNSQNDGPKSKQYYRAITLADNLGAVFLAFSWLPAISNLGSWTAAVFISIIIGTVAVLVSTNLCYYLDRKYKEVGASGLDYFISSVLPYLFALVPMMAILAIDSFAEMIGNLLIAYVDFGLFLLFLVILQYPKSMMFMGRLSKISNNRFLSIVDKLAADMGMEKINLYFLEWRRFKIANAFQAGPKAVLDIHF